MKGVVFTEFLNMVSMEFSMEIVDHMIDDANLPSKGAYTSVGTYSHMEMNSLLVALSNRVGIKVPDLLKSYGRHLFKRLHADFPDFVVASQDSFGFLASIEDVVHTEVKKLYPEAQLPSFEFEFSLPDRMNLTYRSPRCLGDVAEGLMIGCFNHFGETIDVVRTDFDSGRTVKFHLSRRTK